jgi:hypothetical protein
MDISLEQLNEIEEILIEKGWIDLKNNKGSSIANIAFSLFERANDEEEYILLKYLISKYFLCKNYDKHCFDIAKHIESVFYGEKVIIIPVSDERGKIKSGHAIIYDLECFIDEKKFSEILIRDSLNSIEDRISEFNTIVVDDFIGSGSQFRTFVKKCTNSFGLQSSDVYLYSIVMMEKARKRIKDYCYGAVPIFEFPPSLSPPSDLSATLDPVAVYNRIESRAQVGKNYRRGYLKSEALVTMKKTPNNTLPIFWWKGDSDSNLWPAIFPRG